MSSARAINLRAVWRKTGEHAAEQLARFVRLTVLAAVPSLLSLVEGGKFDTRTLLAFIAPFAEVTYRQVFPALGAAKVVSAPGATVDPAPAAAVGDFTPGDSMAGHTEIDTILLVLTFVGVLLLLLGVVLH